MMRFMRSVSDGCQAGKDSGHVHDLKIVSNTSSKFVENTCLQIIRVESFLRSPRISSLLSVQEMTLQRRRQITGNIVNLSLAPFHLEP